LKLRIQNKKAIFGANILNFILLFCFFELFWFPWIPFHSDEIHWIKETNYTFEYNKKKKIQEAISLYAHAENGKIYTLMCHNAPLEQVKVKTPFMLEIDRDYIFRIPVKARVSGKTDTYLIKDFIPVLFLAIFGIIHNVILVVYNKNLGHEVFLLGLLNLAILVYLIFYRP